MEKLIINNKEYIAMGSSTYDFNGIKGRYFYIPNSYNPWIALLEDGTLLSLYNGIHHPFNAEYELIKEN